MKLRLIDGWYTFKSWWSFWLKLAGSSIIVTADFLQHILSTWGAIPSEFKEYVPQEWLTYVGVALVVASFFAQLVRQDRVKAEADRHRAERAAEREPGTDNAEERGRGTTHTV